MAEKESTMSTIKEGHMARFKAGKIKDKEQLVICKLMSCSVGGRPEIHIFTDGSAKEPSSVVKVKSFASVRECDQVPKIVKAKYDNYLCITGNSNTGKTTYLRADTREQRDEWCRELQALIDQRATSNPQLTSKQPSQPHRERTQTESTSNRPAISRTRKGTPITAPGTMQGIFKEELDKVVKKRITPAEPIEEVDDSHICCDRHHIEHAHCEDTYENVHRVDNEHNWRRQQKSSKDALKKTQELYDDFHKTNMLQEQLDQSENEYETPDFLSSDNRLLGCSNSPEESEVSASEMSAVQSLHSCREPTESSWPSSPESSEELEPEYLAPDLPNVKEPEASLCTGEQIYENTSLFQRRQKTDVRPPPLPRAASLRNEQKPNLPPRKSSLPFVTFPQVPPKLPIKNQAMKNEELYRKIKEEKVSGTAKVRVAKIILVRNLFLLSLKEIKDCIIVMDVPRGLKDYFRVGDQWLKVNDALLNAVQFAQDCIEMSDKEEIEITLKRIPFGTICDFPWTSNNDNDVGLILNGNEVEKVHPTGLAHLRGNLQSNDTTCLSSAGLKCNYVITEVNFDQVHPNASTEEVWEMIKKAGNSIILILHPVDFRTLQRGYDFKEEDDDLYVNFRS